MIVINEALASIFRGIPAFWMLISCNTITTWDKWLEKYLALQNAPKSLTTVGKLTVSQVEGEETPIK